jgi:hypothetical protein
MRDSPLKSFLDFTNFSSVEVSKLELPVGYELFVFPQYGVGELKFWGATIQSPIDLSHENIMRLIGAHQSYLTDRIVK